ncbi:MAG TPA: DNA polymerase II [Candidatus Nanoarchaeia archaeon]|nr:DNA polymerase II [Candidatus Nanoarchaeia archaeon]
MKGFIVYSTYQIDDEKTTIQLFGRLENGQSFAAINRISPYFFVKESNLKEIEKHLSKYKVEKTELKNFQGEKVVKISAENHRELNKLIQSIHKIDKYESDIKPHMRFLIDNDILSTVEIEGNYETSEKVDRIYNAPNLKPVQADFKQKLKVISIDIESNKKLNNLFCIGLSGNNYKKVFFITKNKLENAVSCKDEEEALVKFREEIIKLDPDIIVGWNVIDFDLKYLESLFNKYKIPFDIGRTNSPARLRIEESYMRSSSADVPGRQVLDGLNMIKDPFLQQAPSMRNAEFESYSLDDVSNVILGKGKLMKGKGRHDEIEKLYKSGTNKNHQALADYNLTDCELVYEILEKTKTIELATERSELTGMPLDRITASIAAFDSLYIREARKRGLVSPATHYGAKEERIKGGYVFSAKSGVFNNVLVLDFKSLYSSILCTFNIDPAAHITEKKAKKEKNAIESPNHEFFKNEEGILPHIIQKLHAAREKFKKEKNELASYAIKTTMNSFWGVLASPNCRYFNLNMANAITSYARWIIQKTAEEIEKKGYKVIYSDTDSVFVETNLGKEKANKLGAEIQDSINNFYKEHVKKLYHRTSYLELQFDKQYISMMIPSLRMKKGEEDKNQKAAKKRYAGLVEKNGKEELEITGLEAIRGDWTEAAREFQKELLMKLFKKEPIEPFIRAYAKKIREGKLDSQLIYRKSLRKSIEEYTKTTPPHVKAARLLDNIESNIIEYYVTTKGPEPIQKLKHKIDYEHYIKKQIAPIANQILSLQGKSLEDIEKNSNQAKLF